MSTTTRLLAFALVLLVALGAGWALGAAVGPVDAGTGTGTGTGPAATITTVTTMAGHSGAHP